eukprot:57295-Pleurochrysis_carterae.AAC.4
MANVNACSVITGAALLLPCRKPTDCSAWGPVINVARPIRATADGIPHPAKCLWRMQSSHEQRKGMQLNRILNLQPVSCDWLHGRAAPIAAEGPNHSGDPIRAHVPKCSMRGVRAVSKVRGGRFLSGVLSTQLRATLMCTLS